LRVGSSRRRWALTLDRSQSDTKDSRDGRHRMLEPIRHLRLSSSRPYALRPMGSNCGRVRNATTKTRKHENENLLVFMNAFVLSWRLVAIQYGCLLLSVGAPVSVEPKNRSRPSGSLIILPLAMFEPSLARYPVNTTSTPTVSVDSRAAHTTATAIFVPISTSNWLAQLARRLRFRQINSSSLNSSCQRDSTPHAYSFVAVPAVGILTRS